VDARHIAAHIVAWGGAVLFAASLLYFLFSYSVTFGEIVHGRLDAGAILVNVGLFSVFALHHSVFARNRVRELVRSVVPHQLERSVYVWVASLMLIGVCSAWRMVPGLLWQVSAPWSWGFTAIQLWAVWLTLRSAGVIDGLELAGLRQVLEPKAESPKPEPDFKTTGPYGWVRHPIYLGWILLVFSVGEMTMTRFVFAAVSTVYLLIAIPLEERTIRANAGPAYDDYMRRVPRKLIPRIY
jgi:protein-S-isoprenylcysteine O-methyltransferase Ste14